MKILIFFVFLNANLFSYFLPGIVSFALDLDTGKCVRTIEQESRECTAQENRSIFLLYENEK